MPILSNKSSIEIKHTFGTEKALCAGDVVRVVLLSSKLVLSEVGCLMQTVGLTSISAFVVLECSLSESCKNGTFLSGCILQKILL